MARESGELPDLLLPVDAGLAGWPRIDVDADQQARFRHGQKLQLPGGRPVTGRLRVYGPEENLLGLAQVASGWRSAANPGFQSVGKYKAPVRNSSRNFTSRARQHLFALAAAVRMSG